MLQTLISGENIKNMKRKNLKFIYGFLFILLVNPIFSQEKVKINVDALKSFNPYLTNKSIIDDVKGKLAFNTYSNALDYESITLMYENPITEKDIDFKMTVNFSIPLNELKMIEEIIAQQGEIIIVQYKFHLENIVKWTMETKEKGKWLDKKVNYDNELNISIASDINLTELSNIKTIIRDVFSNVEFVTRIQQH